MQLFKTRKDRLIHYLESHNKALELQIKERDEMIERLKQNQRVLVSEGLRVEKLWSDATDELEEQAKRYYELSQHCAIIEEAYNANEELRKKLYYENLALKKKVGEEE